MGFYQLLLFYCRRIERQGKVKHQCILFFRYNVGYKNGNPEDQYIVLA